MRFARGLEIGLSAQIKIIILSPAYRSVVIVLFVFRCALLLLLPLFSNLHLPPPLLLLLLLRSAFWLAKNNLRSDLRFYPWDPRPSTALFSSKCISSGITHLMFFRGRSVKIRAAASLLSSSLSSLLSSLLDPSLLLLSLALKETLGCRAFGAAFLAARGFAAPLLRGRRA